MKIVVVKRINDVNILASLVNERMVPIKPICKMLGVDYRTQKDKILANPLFKEEFVLQKATGADGKSYEMHCLPVKFIYAWILGINASNVKEEIRDRLIGLQRECCNALEEYFDGKQKQRDKSIQRTVYLTKRKDFLRKKPDKTVEDFIEYLNIEDELKGERTIRAKITRTTIAEYKSFFSDKEMLGK
ncbi:MAG: phage antirepressor N-terminal domain-containing protein [Tannerellaceae bacterium]|nr:phage antirepressor N-terminal domain-containing protein [Tannerellaceae bacterium]